jgi:hypothetical protein
LPKQNPLFMNGQKQTQHRQPQAAALNAAEGYFVWHEKQEQ